MSDQQTIEDLRAALRPGGYVASHTASLGNRLVYLQKTYVQTLVATLCRQQPRMPVEFVIENAENTGHWENPRRLVILR